MPRIKTEWESFVVYANDHLPPHVHCRLKDGTEYRIDLRSGHFIDNEPSSGMKKRIMKSYQENVDRILTSWEDLHSADR